MTQLLYLNNNRKRTFFGNFIPDIFDNATNIGNKCLFDRFSPVQEIFRDNNKSALPSLKNKELFFIVLAQRNPLLLLLLPGLLLLRLDARKLSELLLFQLPPRLTRLEPLKDSLFSDESFSKFETVSFI
jgi:hypothetical protein